MQYSTHIDNQMTRHTNARLLGRPVGPVTIADVSGLDWKAQSGQHSLHHDIPTFRNARLFFGGGGGYSSEQNTYGLFNQRVV